MTSASVSVSSLEYEGRTLTLTHFNQQPKGIQTGRQSKYIIAPGREGNNLSGSKCTTIRPPKKYTVKATIKGQREAMAPGTFIAAGKGDSILPFQRTSKSRSPIEAVRTLSVPQMISGRAENTIQELLATNLEKRFEHHIKQIIK